MEGCKTSSSALIPARLAKDAMMREPHWMLARYDVAYDERYVWLIAAAPDPTFSRLLFQKGPVPRVALRATLGCWIGTPSG